MQPPRSIHVRSLAAARCALLAFALCAVPATAQQQLPRDFAARQQMSQADKATIASFVEDWTPLLTSEDPAEAADAIKALNAPFDAQSISVAFRLAYSDAIAPTLDALIINSNSRVAFVAANLAGKIATARTARTLASALEDDRPAVRYAASVGYRELLDPVFADQTLAIGAGQIPNIFKAIEEAMMVEQDPFVVEGLVSAVSGAAAANNIAASDQALTALSRATGVLASRLRAELPIEHPQSWDRAIYRAVKQAYDVSLQQQIDRGQISNEFARQAGIASGLALAYVNQRIATADLADIDDTAAIVPLAEIAEQFLVIVNTQVNTGTRLTGAKARRAATDAIDNNDPARFTPAIDEYMALIKRSPYSVPADQLP